MKINVNSIIFSIHATHFLFFKISKKLLTLFSIALSMAFFCNFSPMQKTWADIDETCTDTSTRDAISKFIKQKFSEKMSNNEDFKNILCANFIFTPKRSDLNNEPQILQYDFSINRTCTELQKTALLNFYLNSESNCNPLNIKNMALDTDNVFSNQCTAILEDSLKSEVSLERASQLQLLFSATKIFVINFITAHPQLSILSSISRSREAVQALNNLELDVTSRLSSTNSGLAEISTPDYNVQPVLQLRGKVFGSDVFIISTMLHEFGHVLEKYFHAYLSEKAWVWSQIFVQYSSINSSEDVSLTLKNKRIQEIEADLWSGMMTGFGQKNKIAPISNFSVADLSNNFCQLQQSTMKKTDYYQQSKLPYLHPQDRKLLWQNALEAELH